ncbi:MAG TPA: TonB-dependent receptor [Haliangium sp.]|nr:TonB-dependent receptor [Haliangium sp.]
MAKGRYSMKRNRTWYGTRACAGLATLLATASGSAWAQDAPQEPEVEVPGEDGAAEPEGEVIVVTGSRIRTDPLDKQAPVLQLTREELERTGLTSVGDILQQLPSSGGAINSKFNSSGNFGFPPDGGGIGAGAIEADLRYLGSKRVLVLVDGVRWVNGSSASGVSAATDLNTIPLAMIERVEVLEDGASPIYGSDAIAGVINIITRKDFEGASVNAYGGGYHYGDGLTQKYDATWGNTDDKMSIVFSASYVDSGTVRSADREQSDYPVPGLDECTGACSSATPQGRFVFKDPRLPPDADALSLTLKERVGGLGNYDHLNPTGGDFEPFTVDKRFNFAPYNLVQTPSQRLGLFSSVRYKLADRVSFFGKASFTNRESLNQAAPEPIFVGPESGNGNRLDRIAIHATNPYNPFGFTFDPATNPFFIARRPVEAGPRRFEQTVNTFYTSGGLAGNFRVGTQRFDWDATVAYGVNRADQLRNNAVNSAKLEQALGPAYQDGNGVWRCGTSATQPGDPDCVPFNIFGGQGIAGEGTITQSMLDYVAFVQHDVSEQTLVDAVANVAGNLVDLPTGALSMAAGLEHRRLSGFFQPDAIVAAGDGADVPAQPTSGDYYVNEAYAELRVPLVVRMPGAELLDANGAVRVSDYSYLSPEVTGKVGARWKPMTDLMLRGSFSRGFRAPSIGEIYGSEARYDATILDPCSLLGPGTDPDVLARCVELGVPADGSYEQFNQQIGVATGGNRDLEAEISNSLNISLAYSPAWLEANPWVDSFDVEMAYYDIRLDGAIAPMDAQLQLDRCILEEDDYWCQGINRTPQGTINGFRNTLLNFNGLETRGIDVALTYLMPVTQYGRFRFTSLSNYLIDFHELIPATGGVEDRVKREGRLSGEPERAFPKFKSSLVIDWFFNAWRTSFVTRYVHSTQEECRGLSAYPGLCSDPNPNDALSRNKLEAQVYNDVQVTWTPPEFDNALNVTLGVTNLFNNDPPICFSCSLNGFNATTYDVPGMFGYLTASYRMY